jgi:hypothetical protein
MYSRVRRCPVLVELDGSVLESGILALSSEQAVDVAMKLREKGWSPFRVRFDENQASWIVSSLTGARV